MVWANMKVCNPGWAGLPASPLFLDNHLGWECTPVWSREGVVCRSQDCRPLVGGPRMVAGEGVAQARLFLVFVFFVFFVCLFFRAAPMAYGGSQARGPIGAAPAPLHHSHSNTRSKPHPRPMPELTAMVTLEP